MKNILALKHLLLPVILSVAGAARSQARLVLNGAQVVIAGNATLVLENGAANAITRFGGSIISEGEGNKVQWMIGQNTGTYTLPWGNGTTYLPLTFSKSAGIGAGNFLFSTFPTPPQNSLRLPAGVTDLNRNGTDKSHYFIDRFWQISAQGYSSKPSLANVSFGYVDAEHALPNTIVEAALGAARWNDDTKTWDGFGPAGVADLSTNSVTVPGVNSTDLFNWWSLMMDGSVLPARFLSFTASRQGNSVALLWKTGDEVEVQDYEVQRSVNGNRFLPIAVTPASGRNTPNEYSHTDGSPAPGTNAYRIKERGRNGTFHYSETRTVVMDQKQEVEVFPNPLTGRRFTIDAIGIPAGSYTIQLYGLEGKLVASFVRVLNGNLVAIELDQPLAKGIYGLKLTSGVHTFSVHLVVN